MSSASSSGEDQSHFEFWDDWELPSDSAMQIPATELAKDSFNYFNTRSSKSFCNTFNRGNWIPPLDFDGKNGPSRRLSMKRARIPKEIKEKNYASDDKFYNALEKRLKGSNTSVMNVNADLILNVDWGEKVELHDISNFNDGDLLWGIVNAGYFAHINLGVNEYKNLCASAEGTISKEGSLETSIISILSAQHLRKMLNVSQSQWSSLCELVLKNNAKLKFEALSDSKVMKMTYLEKLWFYMCKRRHLLPDQCMLVKFSGAVKSMKQFRIIPKLVVQDIRDELKTGKKTVKDVNSLKEEIKLH